MLSLGIDLSLSTTGFAIVDDKYQLIDYYYVYKKETKNDESDHIFLLDDLSSHHVIQEFDRINFYFDKYRKILTMYNDISTIVVETPSNHSASSFKNQIAFLYYSTLYFFYKNKYKTLLVSPKTIKKEITDNGNASKQEIIETIRNKYKIFINSDIKRQKTLSDIYDAIGLAILGVDYYHSKNKNHFLKNKKIDIIWLDIFIN